jgi:predicted transcriptional regulator
MFIKTSRYNRFFSIIILILIVFSLFIILFSGSSLAQGDSGPPDAEISPGSSSDFITTSPGSTATYTVSIENMGDQWESFIISIESEFDWSVNADPQTGVGLSPGESQDIRITFQIPDNLQNKDYQFELIVKSRGFPAGQKTIHVIVSDQDVVITAVLRPVIFIKPSRTDLGKVSPGDLFDVEIEVRCYVVSAEVYLDYELLKKVRSILLPDNNITAHIEPESQYIKKGGSESFQVTITFDKDFDKKVNYNSLLRLEAKAFGYDPITKPKTISLVVFHKPPDGNFLDIIMGSPVAIVGITSIVILGIIGGAIGVTEVGKYKFLLLLFIPLYTKLHKDKILDHFTRGRVYEYVRNHPGAHYSEIKRELGLNNGSLTYHLHTLEREALVKSQNVGRYKLFYPTGAKIPKDMEPQMSLIRNQILDIIRDEPGITQKKIALQLNDKSQRTISYHVKNMTREGIIRVEKAGRENKCYINDEVLEAGQVKFIEAKDDLEEKQEKFMDDDAILRQI